jgi:magnesium transporter
MTNTLLLPELREFLAENNHAEMHEFCAALHPASAAEFMEGLAAEDTWRVLVHAEPDVQAEIFGFIDHDKQVEIINTQPREQIAKLLGNLSADDRVDILKGADDAAVEEVLKLVPAEERREIIQLTAYPEGTAGAVMTTEFASLSESLTVRQAIEELSHQEADLETVYYIYIVDKASHLRGLVTIRRMLSSIVRRPDTKVSDLMETNVVAVKVTDDQETVANTVARYDMLAIPVVDEENRIVGIITHDDIIDVVREEAAEDAQMAAAVAPLEQSYIRTSIFELSWKRGMWLALLFVGSIFTALTLGFYEENLVAIGWLVVFIPMLISCGGNCGNQSATLVITSLTMGEVRPRDWLRIVRRELQMGLLLGAGLGLIGFAIALIIRRNLYEALVIPATLILVIVASTTIGSVLPLLFKRMGLDPALMSNPFVAGIMDILGILIYINVALLMLM